MNLYQVMQAVKVNAPNLEDHGRAGTVRSTPYTEGTGKNARQVVDVELDADATRPAGVVSIDPDKLQSL